MNEKRHPTGAWMIFLALIAGILAAAILYAKPGLIILLAVVAFLAYGTRVDKFYRERRGGLSLPMELPEEVSETEFVDQTDSSDPASYAWSHNLAGSPFSESWEQSESVFKD